MKDKAHFWHSVRHHNTLSKHTAECHTPFLGRVCCIQLRQLPCELRTCSICMVCPVKLLSAGHIILPPNGWKLVQLWSSHWQLWRKRGFMFPQIILWDRRPCTKHWTAMSHASGAVRLHRQWVRHCRSWRQTYARTQRKQLLTSRRRLPCTHQPVTDSYNTIIKHNY